MGVVATLSARAVPPAPWSTRRGDAADIQAEETEDPQAEDLQAKDHSSSRGPSSRRRRPRTRGRSSVLSHLSSLMLSLMLSLVSLVSHVCLFVESEVFLQSQLLHRMLEESPDCQPTLTSGSLASKFTWRWIEFMLLTVSVICWLCVAYVACVFVFLCLWNTLLLLLY